MNRLYLTPNILKVDCCYSYHWLFFLSFFLPFFCLHVWCCCCCCCCCCRPRCRRRRRRLVLILLLIDNIVVVLLILLFWWIFSLSLFLSFLYSPFDFVWFLLILYVVVLVVVVSLMVGSTFTMNRLWMVFSTVMEFSHIDGSFKSKHFCWRSSNLPCFNTRSFVRTSNNQQSLSSL